MNPPALAYIGDGIFSDLIRKYLLGYGHQNVNFMTKTSISYVRASAQAQINIRALLPQLLKPRNGWSNGVGTPPLRVPQKTPTLPTTAMPPGLKPRLATSAAKASG